MKAVNVDEVLKIIHKYGEYVFVTDYKIYTEMQDEIANLKAIEPQPKMGHWIELGYVGNDNYDFECSECHHTDTHSKTVKVNYCWNCGAKMQEESEE